MRINMDDNLAPHLSAKSLRIMNLFKQFGHDMDKLLAAHPEITAADVAQVTTEVIRAMGIMTHRPKPATQSRRKKRGPAGAYQIKITLRGSKPPIWRRVLVPGEFTLAQLHHVIQTSMGWCDGHLHAFIINDVAYSGRSFDGYEPENGGLDESKYRLCDVVAGERAKFRYDYDFGDGWEHALVLEKVVADATRPKTVVCLAGKGRCPPEDCGGIWGYYRLLDVSANPNHEEHKDMMEWTGGPIDPAEFDLDEVNNALAQMRS